MKEINGNVTISLEDYNRLTELAEKCKEVESIESEWKSIENEKNYINIEWKRFSDRSNSFDEQWNDKIRKFNSDKIMLEQKKKELEENKIKLNEKHLELNKRLKNIEIIENNKLAFIFGLIKK